MKKIRLFLLLPFTTLLMCKAPQQATSPTLRLEVLEDTTTRMEKDSVYLVTQKGDTLENLSQEIEVPLSRFVPDTVTIMGVGDIMMGTHFPDPSYLPRDEGKYLWQEVRPLLSSADITFGNLEGTILDEGGTQKACKNPAICYLFRSPKKLAVNLQENGFDLLSLANNHANDFGPEGRHETQRVLDSLNIAHAGSVDQPFTIQKIGHLRVGFCAFAPNKGAVSLHQADQIIKIIQQLDSLSDIVVASFHAGAEGSKHRHVTKKREYYYGEDRGNVYELSRLMIDHGADVVLGHGPHVVRGIELYKGRIIAYSLGNFLTYGRFNLRGYAGEAPLLELKTDAEGAFLKGKIYSFRQSYTLGPQIDPNDGALKSIRQLSLEDFPESTIIIDSNGSITNPDK